jgi:YegS/Rv2252/BmrU family lipid kinase
MAGDVWIIANPVAGGRGRQRRLGEAIARLESRLPVREVRWTRARGDAERWAREAAAQQVGLVVGAGGDGTVNEIATGLAGTRLAIGILPTGTANVIACELNIPTEPARAARVLLDGKTQRCHLGWAEYQPMEREAASDSAETSAERAFLFSAGVGFDAYVCQGVRPGFKRWARKAAYVIDGLRLYARYRSPRLRVTIDGAESVECCELIVCKARAYAGRFFVAPNASLQRASLETCTYQRPGKWGLLHLVWGMLRGQHLKNPDFHCRETQSVEVHSDDRAYLQLDGDAVGTPPARFTVVRDAVSIVVPSQ